MPYLSRLIEHTGIAVGEPPAVPIEADASQALPLEVETFREAENAPPAGAPSERASNPRRVDPETPAPVAPPLRIGGAGRSIDIDRPATLARAEVPDPPPERSKQQGRDVAVDAIEIVETRDAPPPASKAKEIVPPPPAAAGQPSRPPERSTTPPTSAGGPDPPLEKDRFPTFAEVRTWVAATPAPDEVAPVPMTVGRFDVEEEVRVAPRSRSEPAEARRTHDSILRERDMTQDLHLSIGSIVVTVEAPSAQPVTAAPVLQPARSRRAEMDTSSRLLRHYLRP
jgi:hypothetical protein